MRFSIGSLEVGDGLPCALIAELSNAHNGKLGNAIRLIREAKYAGASAVKFQCYSPSELIQLRGDGTPPPPWDGMSMRELYMRAMTPREWFPELVAECESTGIPWFSSVFGMESLELLESLNCPCYKISSFERDATELRKAVQETGKPWIVSRPDYAEPNVPTLYCPPGYPQRDVDLRRIKEGGFFGFSYHGTNDIEAAASWMWGAKMIEIHFQLDDEPSELESNVSLMASEFKLAASDVRRFEERKRAMAA